MTRARLVVIGLGVLVFEAEQLAARLLTWEQPAELRRETAAAMVSAGRNEREGLPCSLELGRRGHCQQGPQIANVLWTLHVVTGQDLQGDQMAGLGDAHPQLWQEVDNRGLGLTGGSESDRREPPDGLLLDDSFDAVIMGTQVVNSELGTDLTKGGLE